MMDKLDLPDESDASDEDYIPTTSNEVLSEVDSDGDSEEPLTDEDAGKLTGKRKRKSGKLRRRKKPSIQDLGHNNDHINDKQEIAKKLATDEEKKKHADSLWASFKKDTNFKSVKCCNETLTTSSSPSSMVAEIKNGKAEQSKRVKVTQVLEFAGEKVCIEKEIPADTATLMKSDSLTATEKKANKGSGLSSVLNQIGKRSKITTLEKSKLDWEKFKKEENIAEDLEQYNKGKNGYLDRQDFLQRADLRRFEIEKEVRTVERNKRMNNVPL